MVGMESEVRRGARIYPPISPAEPITTAVVMVVLLYVHSLCSLFLVFGARLSH
jgi:hypothetical protein